MSALSNLLNVFRRHRPANRTPVRRSWARPGVEALEERLALSASSFNLHAIAEPAGGSVAYFRSPTTNAFIEKTDQGGLLTLASPGQVSDFSAGLDLNSKAIVFAHLGNSMFYNDGAGWQNLNQPMAMLHFAAVDGGRLYAVGADHSLWEYTVPYERFISYVNPITHKVQVSSFTFGGWTELWGANAVWSLDAVTQSSGVDVVFAVGGDNRLEEYSQGTWQFLVSGSARGSFSAGLDSHGNADVYVIIGGNIDRWTAATGFQTIGCDSLDTLSATSGGQLYDEKSEGPLFRFDEQHPDGPIVPGSSGLNIIDISAAGASDLYLITSNGYLMEYTPNGAWIPWKI